jgi:hypothetical protein
MSETSRGVLVVLILAVGILVVSFVFGGTTLEQRVERLETTILACCSAEEAK